METALDLESSAFGLGGSTPPAPTKRCAGLAKWEGALHSKRSVMRRGGSMPPAGTITNEYGEMAESGLRHSP